MQSTEVLDVLGSVGDIEVKTVSDDAAIVFSHDGTMTVLDSGSVWGLEKDSRKSLLKHLGVTDGLVKKLSRPTAANVLTELYRRGGEACALVSNGDILSFAPKGRYRQVPITGVVEAIQEALPSGVDFHRVHLFPNFDISLEVTGPDEVPVRQDDLIRAGVKVTFSPIGFTDPVVQTYVLRLACTNGATSTTVIEDYSLGIDSDPSNENVYDWLIETSKQAYEGLPVVAAQWQALSEDRIRPSDRALLIGGLAREAKVRGDAADALWAKATEEPPETAYDVLNLMTWLSSHVVNDPILVARIQRASANFVAENTHSKFCPTCQRAGG